MSTMRKLFLLIGAFALGFSNLTMAQCGECKGAEGKFCWGDKPGDAREKWVLVSDGVKMNDLSDQVAEPLEWLLTNLPNLSEGLYINALKFYEAREAKETDPAKKTALEDKIMALYDKRMQCYGEKLDVLDRKARKIYDYYSDRPEKTKELYDFYKNYLTKSGDNVGYATSYVYVLDLACKMKEAGQRKDEEILEEYDLLLPQIDKKIDGGGEDVGRWKDVKAQVENMVQACVKIDCDFVIKNFGPKLKANPTDLKLAKQIMGIMIGGKCTGDPLFREALTIKVKAEPDFTGYALLGKYAQNDKNIDEAIMHYQKAVSLAKDDENQKKAEMLITIGNIQRSQGKLGEARSTYYKAIEADNSVAKDAYSAIGDMYMNSHKSCTGGNELKDRYVFLAAYDMYAKAGDSRGMANAKAQFPSIETIFSLGAMSGGVKEGSTVSIGCWIGATSVLRRR